MSQANLAKSAVVYRPDSSFAGDPSPALCTLREVRYAAAKRALDVALTLVGLIVLFPVFLAIGVVIKLTSPGPILFCQTRVGRGGRTFQFYKFRSMTVDAESRRHELMHLNEADGPVFKMRNDPRITPVGRYLRKWSLDELPQLFNVLKGEMSIVGPRPPLPSEVQDYTARQLGRLAVQPGLTCTWQAGGRSDVGFEEWMQMDLDYIDTMSFWGDLVLIARTVPAVLLGRGAR